MMRCQNAHAYVKEKMKNQTLAIKIFENWSMILLIRSGSNGRPILIQLTFKNSLLKLCMSYQRLVDE